MTKIVVRINYKTSDRTDLISCVGPSVFTFGFGCVIALLKIFAPHSVSKPLINLVEGSFSLALFYVFFLSAIQFRAWQHICIGLLVAVKLKSKSNTRPHSWFTKYFVIAPIGKARDALSLAAPIAIGYLLMLQILASSEVSPEQWVYCILIILLILVCDHSETIWKRDQASFAFGCWVLICSWAFIGLVLWAVYADFI